MDIPAIAIKAETIVKATASNVFQKQNAHYGPAAAFDGDEESRWATDTGTRQAWIAADLGKPVTVQRVRIDEAFGKRVQKFELQYREGETWKTLLAGQTIGAGFQKTFEPVTAREFRLNILDATDGPTLNEIELLEK